MSCLKEDVSQQITAQLWNFWFPSSLFGGLIVLFDPLLFPAHVTTLWPLNTCSSFQYNVHF